MSRYFFHVFDGKAILDTVGIELPNLEAARREAVESSGGMLAHHSENWRGGAWRMVVADEAGTIVFSTSFTTDRHGF